jgi:hypothetical protein
MTPAYKHDPITSNTVPRANSTKAYLSKDGSAHKQAGELEDGGMACMGACTVQIRHWWNFVQDGHTTPRSASTHTRATRSSAGHAYTHTQGVRQHNSSCGFIGGEWS